MKTLLPTVLALLAGFAGGWLAKPAPIAPAPAPALASTPAAPSMAKPTGTEGQPPAPPVRKRILSPDAPVPSGVLPTGPAADSIEAAKLQRLTELLSLDEAGRETLKKILDDCRKAPSGDPSKPVGPKESLDHLSNTAVELERSLAALFTPEQAAAFKELRQREREGRIESKAQRDLGRLAETTDLTSAQREQILAKLRHSATAEMDALPPAVSLLASPSVLPLGTAGMPVDSILELSRLSGVDASTDHGAVFAKLNEQKLAKIDAQLAELKPLVTPAQYAQLEAAAAQQRAIRQRMLQPPR